MIETGNAANRFKDFKFGNDEDRQKEESWKQEFMKRVNQRPQTGMSWTDYRTIMVDGRNGDE